MACSDKGMRIGKPVKALAVPCFVVEVPLSVPYKPKTECRITYEVMFAWHPANENYIGTINYFCSSEVMDEELIHFTDQQECGFVYDTTTAPTKALAKAIVCALFNRSSYNRLRKDHREVLFDQTPFTDTAKKGKE